MQIKPSVSNFNLYLHIHKYEYMSECSMLDSFEQQKGAVHMLSAEHMNEEYTILFSQATMAFYRHNHLKKFCPMPCGKHTFSFYAQVFVKWLYFVHIYIIVQIGYSFLALFYILKSIIHALKFALAFDEIMAIDKVSASSVC